MKKYILDLCEKLFDDINNISESDFKITKPEMKFGDFSTNIAFILSKQLRENPKTIAQDIVDSFQHPDFKKVKQLNGFINFYYSDEFLEKNINK